MHMFAHLWAISRNAVAPNAEFLVQQGLKRQTCSRLGVLTLSTLTEGLSQNCRRAHSDVRWKQWLVSSGNGHSEKQCVVGLDVMPECLYIVHAGAIATAIATLKCNCVCVRSQLCINLAVWHHDYDKRDKSFFLTSIKRYSYLFTHSWVMTPLH